LKRGGLPTDDAALLNYLRSRSASDADLARIPELVKELGDDNFTIREKAKGKLCALEIAALAELRRHIRDKDMQRARNVKECVEHIEKNTHISYPLLAIRLLMKRKATGTAEDVIVAFRSGPLVCQEKSP
jgi:hypothetical protein